MAKLLSNAVNSGNVQGAKKFFGDAIRFRPVSCVAAIGIMAVLSNAGCSFQSRKATGDQVMDALEYAMEKDLIDMKGYVTTAGSQFLAETRPPATQDAECLKIARERNVRIVGKTNLTEFAITVTGKNSYFGTPVNRWDGKNKVIPGGSSSGSAVAISTGRADVSFGTDTGGSIRVPAAFCGIYGLKTTYGLVSTKGVFPISPKHLDTVGPMAKDIPHLVTGMGLLQRGFEAKYRQAVAKSPSARQIRIGRLYIPGTAPEIDQAIDKALLDKGFKVVRLSDGFLDKWKQADADGETIALGDAWQNDRKYTDNLKISRTTRLVIAKGGLDYATAYPAAVKRKAAWQKELRRVLAKVDFIATPTLQSLPSAAPLLGSSIVFELLVFNSQNTVGINFSGNPAIAIPIPLEPKGKTKPVTSLQLVGPMFSEAELINAARLVSADR